MSKYRHRLPSLFNRPVITDAGLEAWLVFREWIELRHFAAYELLETSSGIERLCQWYRRFAEIARANRSGLLLESPTWRANPDWAIRLWHDLETLADLNRIAMGLLVELRTEMERPEMPVIFCGNMGPRGDGYVPSARMSAREAEAHHRTQVRTFAGTDDRHVAAIARRWHEATSC